MDGGHETLSNAELVVDDLGERGQAVGGAGCVGEDVDVLGVGLFVDTDDKHGRVGRRGGDDDLLGTTLQVELGLFMLGEDTGRLDHVPDARVLPGDVGGVLFAVELDGLAVDNERVTLVVDRTLEDAVGTVVFEHVGGVVNLNEGVVDGDNVYASVFETVDGVRIIFLWPLFFFFFFFSMYSRITEDDTADTTESVDSNLDRGSIRGSSSMQRRLIDQSVYIPWGHPF